MQLVSASIWTRIAVSTSLDGNRYTIQFVKSYVDVTQYACSGVIKNVLIYTGELI